MPSAVERQVHDAELLQEESEALNQIIEAFDALIQGGGMVNRSQLAVVEARTRTLAESNTQKTKRKSIQSSTSMSGDVMAGNYGPALMDFASECGLEEGVVDYEKLSELLSQTFPAMQEAIHLLRLVGFIGPAGTGSTASLALGLFNAAVLCSSFGVVYPFWMIILYQHTVNDINFVGLAMLWNCTGLYFLYACVWWPRRYGLEVLLNTLAFVQRCESEQATNYINSTLGRVVTLGKCVVVGLSLFLVIFVCVLPSWMFPEESGISPWTWKLALINLWLPLVIVQLTSFVCYLGFVIFVVGEICENTLKPLAGDVEVCGGKKMRHICHGCEHLDYVSDQTAISIFVFILIFCLLGPLVFFSMAFRNLATGGHIFLAVFGIFMLTIFVSLGIGVLWELSNPSYIFSRIRERVASAMPHYDVGHEDRRQHADILLMLVAKNPEWTIGEMRISRGFVQAVLAWLWAFILVVAIYYGAADTSWTKPTWAPNSTASK